MRGVGVTPFNTCCTFRRNPTASFPDYGLGVYREGQGEPEGDGVDYSKVYNPPEFSLDDSRRPSPAADMYAFSIILYEIATRAGPYGVCMIYLLNILTRLVPSRVWAYTTSRDYYQKGDCLPVVGFLLVSFIK